MALHYFPAFVDNDELNDQLNRAVWYFDSLIGESLNFYSCMPHEYEIEPYFSTELSIIYNRQLTENKLKINDADKLGDVLPEKEDYIIQWKAGDELSRTERVNLQRLKSKGAKIFDVNKTRRMEGSLYIEVSRDFYEADVSFVAVNKVKFKTISEKYNDKEKAFLFCTGPSIDEYVNYRYEEGITIVCNSVINDEEFMRIVKPDILVFADPIFHFGCSTYAEAFRKRLKDVASRYTFDILIPIKYYPLFCHNLPELAERTMAIPYQEQNHFGLDLNNQFSVKTTDNILTFLMLPIATSLAEKIYIMGCDGRPLDEDDYFWSHNKKTQFSSEMSSIQQAHPSFFKLEYNEYYLRHCDNVRSIFEQGEEKGKQYISLGFSHIPALTEREFKYRHLAHNVNDSLYVSINPDLKNEFGHYYHYDERLYETLRGGQELLILGNKKAGMDGVACSVENIFLRHSWAVRWNQNTNVLTDWCDELSYILDDLLILRRQKHVYMYMGAIRFYVAILETLLRYKSLNSIDFKLNLFYAHMDYSKDGFIGSTEFLEYNKFLNYSAMSRYFPIQIYSDSERLRAQLYNDFGVNLNLWPMIGVTSPTLIENAKSKKCEHSSNNHNVYVLFPGNGQITKGFDLACDLLSSYDEAPAYNGRKIKFLIRDQFRDNEDNNKVLAQKLAIASTHPWVDVIEGHLTEEEYLSLYLRADAVILPYRKSAFYSRTSGCLVDALSFEIPILTFSDTWLGDWVDTLKVGKGVADGDIEAMKVGLLEVLTQTTSYPVDVDRKFGAANLKNLLNDNIGGSKMTYPIDLVAANLRRLFHNEASDNNKKSDLKGAELYQVIDSLLLLPSKESETSENFHSINATPIRIKRIAYRLESHPMLYNFARRCWLIFKKLRSVV